MTSFADDTRWLDATAQAELVRTGQVKPVELLDAAIERIEHGNDALNAVTLRWFDAAHEAASADALPDGPFRGVPFLLKDLYADFAGQPITNGNQALRDALPIARADTTLVARHRAAGFVIAGRTNSPELGTLPVTEPLAHGPTRNPWDPQRTPGGSSGGAAAAVAAGFVPIAHASDGGGSIRIPAACCGLVGLKPSQGRITLGPIRHEGNLSVEHAVSRTVRDTAALLDATWGPGIGDTVIAPAPTRPYREEVGADPGRLRVGVLDHDPLGSPIHPDCAQAARATAELLASLGHQVDTSWPEALSNPEMTGRFMAVWATNAAVAIDSLGRLIGRELGAEDVEPVNWVQAQYAKQVSAVDLAAAQQAIVDFRRAVQGWWSDGWDLLVTPTFGEPPMRIGEHDAHPDDPLAGMKRAAEWVRFTPAFNMSGQPAISLPMHWTDENLPIGVQLVAAYGREDLLIRVAAQLESAQPWESRRPPAVTTVR